MLVGYMRVSTSEQNLALQRDALQRAGCDCLYEDTCSGAVTDRPGLAKALDHLRTGEQLGISVSTLYAYVDGEGQSKPRAQKLLGR